MSRRLRRWFDKPGDEPGDCCAQRSSERRGSALRRLSAALGSLERIADVHRFGGLVDP
jgi:hypothetical protein